MIPPFPILFCHCLQTTNLPVDVYFLIGKASTIYKRDTVCTRWALFLAFELVVLCSVSSIIPYNTKLYTVQIIPNTFKS